MLACLRTDRWIAVLLPVPVPVRHQAIHTTTSLPCYTITATITTTITIITITPASYYRMWIYSKFTNILNYYYY